MTCWRVTWPRITRNAQVVYASTMGSNTAVASSMIFKVSSLDEASHTVSPCAGRSEEHTSELQSLMRISYAVFCLKKKLQLTTQQSHPTSADQSTQHITLKQSRKATHY